jgi:2-oxoglutarate dehydrogenase E2 component (dihydrolipoamide succinyltransferase)
MATVVTMPSLGESVLEGTVGKWLVREGDRVEREQMVVEILTDKTDSPVPSPVGGIVTKLFVKENDVIPVGAKLCEIDETATASVSKPVAAAAPAAAAPAAAHDDVRASPSVKKLAREMDLDIKHVVGTGQGGVITRDDVLKAGGPAPAHPATPPPAPAPRATSAGVSSPGLSSPGLADAMKVMTPTGLGAFKVPPYVAKPGDKVVPFNRIRRVIADHMVYSKLTAPHVVTFAECDLQKTHLLREANKDALKKEGVNLTFLSFVTAAVARALREFPVMNARVLDGAYVELADVNVGLAVETNRGLVVPVLRNADMLKVRGLAKGIDEVAKRARDGLLAPDDVSGGTFSISNPGKKGNLVGGAIISQPNVGILRIGEIKKRVVVIEHDGADVMAIHPVMMMALSYDHRIVDGVVANGFLFRVNELLEAAQFDI